VADAQAVEVGTGALKTTFLSLICLGVKTLIEKLQPSFLV
jgi:hypothetical protein